MGELAPAMLILDPIEDHGRRTRFKLQTRFEVNVNTRGYVFAGKGQQMGCQCSQPCPVCLDSNFSRTSNHLNKKMWGPHEMKALRRVIGTHFYALQHHCSQSVRSTRFSQFYEATGADQQEHRADWTLGDSDLPLASSLAATKRSGSVERRL
jgi:hypothetical protein